MKIPENVMRQDYHLKNNLVIKYFKNRVSDNGEGDKFDYNGHKRALENLCGGDQREFNNAVRCLKAKMEIDLK